MVPALTATPWLKTLQICVERGDETTSRLASMLYEIIDGSVDPCVGEIVDRYARRMLEGQP